MYRSMKALLLMTFALTLLACKSTPEHTGPVGKIDNSKWEDSGAWASGNATWAYDVAEVYDATTMKRVYEDSLLNFSTRIEMPVGEYIVKTKCFFNTRRSQNPYLYTKFQEHTVTVIENKTVTFDFSINGNVCSLNQRIFPQ